MYTKVFETEHHPSLKDIFQVIWKRLWVVVLTVIVIAGAAVGFSFLQTPVYEASAMMLVGEKPTKDSDRSTSLGGDIQGLQQVTQTVTVAIGSKPIAEGVVQQLDLQTEPANLLKNLSVEQVRDTQFIEVKYRNPDPENARRVVNSIGDVAAKRISETSAGASVIEATVWEYAGVPEAPVSPSPLRNGILALGLGLMLGIGLVFLLEYLDDSWRSTEEVAQVSGVPNFGVIPEFNIAKIREIRGN